MFEQFEVAIWFTKFFFLELKVRNRFTEKMFEQFEVMIWFTKFFFLESKVRNWFTEEDV